MDQFLPELVSGRWQRAALTEGWRRVSGGLRRSSPPPPALRAVPLPETSSGRILLLAVPLLLAACAPAAPPAERGATTPRIVSLNPCTDAILAEVAPERVAALSAYSRDPASSSMDPALARRFPATNGTVEEVLAMKPDLVLTGTFTPPATRAAFARLGIRLEEIGIASSVAESEAQVRRIAALAGHGPRGEALVARIEAALAKAAPPPGSQPIPTLLWEPGGIVPGDDTLVAELLRRAGFANFSASLGMKQADYLPLERVLADPPALVLVAGNPRAEENRLLGHPALKALSGTARARFAPNLLWCGGPTIVRAAERLGEIRAGLGRASLDELGMSGGGRQITKEARQPNPLRLSLSKPAHSGRPTL